MSKKTFNFFLIYLQTKKTLKINNYHTAKHTLNSWVIRLLHQFRLINFTKEAYFLKKKKFLNFNLIKSRSDLVLSAEFST
jgi:hypothetical protein